MLFFFQAEDGIRDYKVTGVQTCALPICIKAEMDYGRGPEKTWVYGALRVRDGKEVTRCAASRNSKGYIALLSEDRKSTRLNSSHLVISYAVFCLKKKNNCTCSFAYSFHR